MATITPVEQSYDKSDAVKTWFWETITEADTAAAVGFPEWSMRNIQVLGTFGTATFVVEGSNDGGTTWFNLADAYGTAISLTAAGGKQIGDVPLLVRPALSGGTGQDVDVYMVMVRPNPIRQ